MVAVPSIGRASQVTPRRAAPEADATRDLYERYARQIYAYCHHQLGNREEAEDAMQSTFLNAFRGFKRGVDPEFESAWLYKIAQNVCLTRQRSSSRRRRVESPGDLDAIQDILPSHEVDSDELIGLPEALQGLPKQQQRALLLREWQGLSYKEIADELALTQAAVETLLFRARRSLAAGLSDDAGKSKSIVSKLRAGTDAGSLIALAQSLLSFGGAKVAATVATVAATSVVASTPTARHAVEHAVAPVKPQHVAPAAHIAKPHAKHSFVATSALSSVAHSERCTFDTRGHEAPRRSTSTSRTRRGPRRCRSVIARTRTRLLTPRFARSRRSCRLLLRSRRRSRRLRRRLRRPSPSSICPLPQRAADSRRNRQSRRDAGGACCRQARGQEQRQRREGQSQRQAVRQARTARDADRDAGDARSRRPAGSGSAGNARRSAGAGSGASPPRARRRRRRGSPRATSRRRKLREARKEKARGQRQEADGRSPLPRPFRLPLPP